MLYTHIDFVHIRSLLSVHFDADKVLIEYVCNCLTLKALYLHHMAAHSSTVLYYATIALNCCR